MAERDSSILNLLDDIRKNPDVIMDFSETELKQLQNKLFSHGVIKSPKTSYAALSIVNWRDLYLRKLHFTTLIGYLFRLVKEFEYPSAGEVGASNLIKNSENFADNAVASVWKSCKQFCEETRPSAHSEETSADAASDETSELRNEELRKQFVAECKQTVHKMTEKFVKEQLEEFLKRHFEYDPDRHVESAFKENMNDPERVGRFPEMKERMETVPGNTAVIHEATSDDKVKELYQTLTSTIAELKSTLNGLEAYKTSEVAKNSTVNELAASASYLSGIVKGFAGIYGKGVDSLTPEVKAALSIADTNSQLLTTGADFNTDGSATPNFSVDDLSGFISKKQIALEETAKNLYFLDEELLKEVRGPYEWLAPTNVFYHIDRYLSNHYEQLREATSILYNERPDIEFQVQYYGSFDTEEGAQEFERKYESNFITSVFTVQNGGWTILGPFKENRSRIDFYNKKTEIIKRMFEQAESDQALGKDLMEKRVRRAKKQNILDAGPDDPGLSKYKAALNTIEALGAKEGLTREEKDELAKAYNEKEMAEVPEDAIQVDVFGTDSEGKFKKSHFYTQAEAPEHMENREEPTSMIVRRSQASANEKKIASRDGKITSLAELKRALPPASPFAE